MNIIRKYLDTNNIPYEVHTNIYRDTYITITLETDNIWVNGYGEDMKWNRTLTMSQNQYKKYALIESTGYSLSKTHIRTGKQKEIVDKLIWRLGK